MTEPSPIVKDLLGNDMQAGDIVSFAVKSGTGARLHLGRITAIVPIMRMIEIEPFKSNHPGNRRGWHLVKYSGVQFVSADHREEPISMVAELYHPRG